MVFGEFRSSVAPPRYIGLADLISSYLTNKMEDVFFTCRLELSEFQLDEVERQEKMKFWHKLSFTGVQLVRYVSYAMTALSLIFAWAMPQPRAALAVVLFVFYLIWLHGVRPVIQTVYYWSIFVSALKTDYFDGYFSYYPRRMDFLYVGVQTSEFLAWRLHRIMKEDIILKQVHDNGFARATLEQHKQDEAAAKLWRRAQVARKKMLREAAEKYK